MDHSELICDPIEFDWEGFQKEQEEISKEMEKENEPETTLIMLNDLVEFPTVDDLRSIEITIYRCGDSTVNSWSAKYCNEPDGSLDFNCAYNAVKYLLGKYFYSKMTYETVWQEACDSLESSFGISAGIFTNAINCHLYKTEITITSYNNSKIVYEL